MLYLQSNQANNIVVTWSERCTTTLPYVQIEAYDHRCDADGALPKEPNCVLNKYAQALGIPLFFVFNLKSIATNETTEFSILRSSNLSAFVSRYDEFSITLGDLPKGQYTYTAFEGDIAVVETGLAQIEYSEQSYTSHTNDITYAEPTTV